MALPAFVVPIITYLFKTVIIKFFVLTAVYIVAVAMLPYAINFITPFTNASGLSNAFASLPPGVMWFLNAFALDYGVPLCISAFVARFLIRRLPLIG